MISLQSAAAVRSRVRPSMRDRGAALSLFALLGCSAALLPGSFAAAQAEAPRTPRSAQAAPTSPPSTSAAQGAPSSTAPSTSTPPASAATGTTTNTPPVSDVPTVPGSEMPAAAGSEMPPAQTEATPPASGDVSPDAVGASERRQIVDELSAVETQLEMVDQRRSDGNIAGPVAMLASGYTTGVVALGVSLGSFAMAEQVEKRDPDDESGGRLDINNDGSVDGDDEATYRRVARGLGIASAVGFAVGIAGNVILGKRLKERRAHDPEIRQLQRRRRELRRELDYGGSASSTGLSLSLGARF